MLRTAGSNCRSALHCTVVYIPLLTMLLSQLRFRWWSQSNCDRDSWIRGFVVLDQLILDDRDALIELSKSSWTDLMKELPQQPLCFNDSCPVSAGAALNPSGVLQQKKILLQQILLSSWLLSVALTHFFSASGASAAFRERSPFLLLSHDIGLL